MTASKRTAGPPRTETVATKLSTAEVDALRRAVEAKHAPTRSTYLADAVRRALLADGYLADEQPEKPPGETVQTGCPHAKSTFRGYARICDACGVVVR